METMQNRRNPSIELLRCVSMFCIVLYHSAVHGRWGNDGSQAVLNLVFGALLMWHVDSFVAISGWFGIRFSWRKFVTLWGEIFFYTMLSAGWAYWFDRTAFSWKLLVTQGGWFAGTYLMLMFMAPLLNEAIESSVRKGRRFAFGVWLTFALGLTLDWLPLSAMSGVAPGGGGGTTILTMVFVYVTARYARLLDLKVGVKTIGGIIALYGVAVAVFGGGVMLFVSQGGA